MKIVISIFLNILLISCTFKNINLSTNKSRNLKIRNNFLNSENYFADSAGDKIKILKNYKTDGSIDSVFSLIIFTGKDTFNYDDLLIKNNSLYKVNDKDNLRLIRDFSKKTEVSPRNEMIDFNSFQIENIENLGEKLNQLNLTFKIVPNYQFFMTDSILLNKYQSRNHPIEYIEFDKSNKLYAIKKYLSKNWYIITSE